MSRPGLRMARQGRNDPACGSSPGIVRLVRLMRGSYWFGSEPDRPGDHMRCIAFRLMPVLAVGAQGELRDQVRQPARAGIRDYGPAAHHRASAHALTLEIRLTSLD